MRWYYDSLSSGLVPVCNVVKFKHENLPHVFVISAEVAKETGPFKRGEKLEFSPRYIVTKAKSTGVFLMCKPVQLELINERT